MKYLLSALLIWGVSVTGNLEAKSGGTTLKAKNGGVPSKINYQGWLGSSTDTTGVTGNLAMIFRIYDAVTGGNELWVETHLSVPVDKGIFNVILGSNAPISSKHFYFDASLWLETQVGNDTLSPRKKFVSVGYAMKSENANYANESGHADNADSADVAGHSVHADTADYAVAAGGVADTANYAKDSDKLDGQHASAFAPATHNHMNESWSTDKGTYGLSKNISVNNSGDVYCADDSAKNAGTGDTYGGKFYAGGSGIGRKYGVYGLAVGPAATTKKSAYGIYGQVGHSGAGNAYGSYGYAFHSNTGSAYGGRFHGAGSGTGTKYGIYGRADGPAASTKNAYGTYGYANHTGTGGGDAYGGRFSAGGSGIGTKYGIFATAGGTGTKWAGYFDGDVHVTGTVTMDTVVRYYSISACEFGAREETYDWFRSNYLRTGTVASHWSAGVNLPDGAVVTEVNGYVLDNDASKNMSIWLYRIDHDAALSTLASGISSGASASTQTITDDAIENATIDNENYSYFAWVKFDGAGPTQKLHQIRIKYEITHPLP